MNVVEHLIKEYGDLTGRPQGWERYMSISEYLEFKKAASSMMVVSETRESDTRKFTQTVTQETQTPVVNRNIPDAPVKKNIPVVPVSVSVKKEENAPSYINSNETSKKIEGNATTAHDDGPSELDLFKMMGE